MEPKTISMKMIILLWMYSLKIKLTILGSVKMIY